MKRLKVAFRPSSLLDLDSIYDWVLAVSANRAVAKSFVSRITAKCRKIGNMPYGERARDDLQIGLRTFPFERTAIIVYRVTDCVEIIRIYFAGQNFEALLSDNAGEFESFEDWKACPQNHQISAIYLTMAGFEMKPVHHALYDSTRLFPADAIDYGRPR